MALKLDKIKKKKNKLIRATVYRPKSAFADQLSFTSVFDLVGKLDLDHEDIDVIAEDEEGEDNALADTLQFKALPELVHNRSSKRPLSAADVLSQLVRIKTRKSHYIADLESKSGYILKASKGLCCTVAWLRFWATLEDKIFMLYADKDDDFPLASINFDSATVVVDIINDNEICIQPMGSEFVIRLRVDNPKDLPEWAVVFYT